MRQLTIVGRNSAGLVADITELLAGNNIDIRNIDSHIAGDDAYVKLVVSDYVLGLQLLTQAGYKTVADNSVLLRVKDEPGALARLARQISDQGIGTRAITMLHQDNGFTIAAISTDNNGEVRKMFKEMLVS
jgi:hypothetical protein